MRLSTVIIVFHVCLMAVMLGCSTADKQRIEDEWDKIKPDTATTTTTTTTQPLPPSLQGSQVFLWKPSSESRGGRAAVLIPACVLADGVTANGEASREPVGRTNDNRETFFMPRAGSGYGNDVTVVAYWQGVETGRWSVPQGGARKEIAHACN